MNLHEILTRLVASGLTLDAAWAIAFPSVRTGDRRAIPRGPDRRVAGLPHVKVLH